MLRRPQPPRNVNAVTRATDHPTGIHSWLDGSAVRIVSDIALGCVLLIAGTIAILSAPTAISFSELEGLDANFFPTAIGGLLVAVGIALLVRGSIFGGPRPARWSLTGLAIIAAGIMAFCAAAVALGSHLLLMFGPSEFATLYILGLTIAVALVRRSRIQAFGMALLGLLLAMVGLDSITGQLRLTFGLEQLIAGIASPVIVGLGIFVVADGLVCLVSPSLWLATYARMLDGRSAPRIPPIAAIGMRIAAALAIAAACYLAFELNRRTWDVGLLLPFAAFGIAGKLLGWNRFVLLLAFVYSDPLEQSIRQSMAMSQGDPTILLSSPFGTALALLAGCILVLAALLSARRALSRRSERGVVGAS
jgi:tripartite tricarboxylate transporter TctA family protein